MRIVAIAAVLTAVLAGGLRGEAVSAGIGGRLSLQDLGVVVAPQIADRDWRMLGTSGGYTPSHDGFYSFSMKDGKGEVVSGRARFSREGDGVRANWDFEVKRDYECNSFRIDVAIPCAAHAGGGFAAGDKKGAFPDKYDGNAWIGGFSADALAVTTRSGRGWKIALDKPRRIGLQDNRKWNSDVFSAQIKVGDNSLKAGERHSFSMLLTPGDGDFTFHTGVVTITAGPDWVPVKDATDIVPGSAMDFSRQGWIDAPAGKHGRVVAKGAHFEYEKLPGKPQRFYGVNLCFSANFPERAAADELASRLSRMGYNALRIHHYESQLTEGSPDGTAINEKRMAQLDDLAAACIEKGIYLTTDLFVSRRPTWRAIGEDRKGNCTDYKDLCLFHEGAYSNLCEFTRQFLCHVNPRTGRRWADEPALAWIALINEGNPGNHGFSVYKSSPVAMAKWKAWLAEKKKSEPAAYGDVAEDAIPGDAYEKSKQCRAFVAFLADLERAFDARFMKFLREEIGCRALYSNMSSWYNPVEYQRVRTAYDYVDDHFYVDHPHFLEEKWRLPSSCPNANPARYASSGFQGVVNHRLLDRPFTITEFNFSGPGRWRGVGGIMLGAQAALQDYDGIWRFAWSHDSKGLLDSMPLSYFDTARDPLTRATERAALCLFLRRDIEPLGRVTALSVPDGQDDKSISRGGMDSFKQLWYGWYSRLGTVVGEPPAGLFASFAHPGLSSVDEAGLKAKLGNMKSGDGHVILDREHGIFGVVSPRTCGFSCEGGTAAAGSLFAEISMAPSAVWVSSLDGHPVESSRRMLLSHVTDVQDESITYADVERKVLLKWGKLPHLMQRGRAEISLRIAGNANKNPKVYALSANGARRGEVPAEVVNGRLTFSADTARDPQEATFAYEIVR